MTAFRRGFPLTYFNPSVFNELIFSRVCKNFSKNGNFNENDFAEISSAALLLALKAKNITLKTPTAGATYDFDVLWFENVIEVEVTRAGQKGEWIQRLGQADELARYAHNLNRSFNINLYVTDVLSDETKEEMKSLIYNLKIGDKIEEQGKWLLFSETSYGDPAVLYKVVEDNNRPKWWPKQMINGFSRVGLVAGPNQVEPLPRTMVKFSCPFIGYINRAKKKATKFQGTRNKPYLLVLDVNELGSPFKELERNFDLYFETWKHITAILVHKNYYYMNEIGWEFQLFINPHATIKLDDLTKNLLSEYTERMRAVKQTEDSSRTNFFNLA